MAEGMTTQANDDWSHAGTGQTNTVAGSVQDVSLDLTPICQNMSNAQFRALIERSRDAAVRMIQDRINRLEKWDAGEQARARRWFGRCDDQTRTTLQRGMPKLLDAMQKLKPENVIRWDQQKQRNITCSVFPDNGYTEASVCKPDSVRRIVAIYPHFCTSPNMQLWRECQVLTLIHECTHFSDVFDSTDDMYGVNVGLTFWAQSNPEKAIRNADSLACYVGFED